MRDREPGDMGFPISPLRRGTYSGSTSGRPIAKENAIEHEGYRRLVAKLPCKVCGIFGQSQSAHPNTGKGQGIKESDLDCFPLCCTRPDIEGCHVKFDQYRLVPKEKMRAKAAKWARETLAKIKAGKLPKKLAELLENHAKPAPTVRQQLSKQERK